MTRADIKLLARQLIQETLGAPTEGDIFGFDAFLTVVTDEIASKADLFYTEATPINVVSGSFRYTAPGLHHITAALALGSDNTSLRILTTVDPARMDRLYGGAWRNWAGADIGDTTAAPVAYAVLEGTASVRLWPPPNTSRSGALLLEGFGAPGATWPNETDTCPLPVWTHRAIAYSLAVERCVQYADTVSDKRVQRLSARAQILMEDMMRQAERFVQGAGKGKTGGPSGTRTAFEAGAAALSP